MTAQDNVKRVQSFFNSFTSGNLDAIDDFFAPDVEYTVVGAHGSETTDAIPWVGLHRGTEAVKSFFHTLVGSIEVVEFDPQEFIAQNDAVAVFGYFKYRARSTGKLMETDWAIRIKFKGSQIVRYHFYEDTYAIAAAFRQTGSWEVENAGRKRKVP